MSEDQRERAIAWLNSKWTASHVCPACGTDAWSIQSAMHEMRAFNGGDLIIGGDSSLYPAIVVMCSNCGYTHLFNAVISGVVGPVSEGHE